MKDSASNDTFYKREERPWGSFEQFSDNEVSTVKLIHVDAGQRLSLQKHSKRSEFWRVVSGSGTFEIDGVARDVSVGDEANIPVGSLHRLAGGADGITILEIARGEFDEHDIERVEDDFGRIEESIPTNT
ncbi:MAG: phosphomannose isomerase type II C-terminal cupin domain [Candidatus Paceibacterota bacterium]